MIISILKFSILNFHFLLIIPHIVLLVIDDLILKTLFKNYY